jgi:hypothetical protein
MQSGTPSADGTPAPSRARGLVRALTPLWRVALVCGIGSIVLGASFVAALAATLTFSSDARIEAHLREAVDRGVLLAESYPVSPYGHTGHAYDMYTDCVAFGTNLGNRDLGLLRRIAASPYVAPSASGDEAGGDEAIPDLPCEALVYALERGPVRADFNYIRFWHGYQVFHRPLLSVMSVQNVRRVTAVLFYSVLIFFTAKLAESFGAWAWPVLLLPYVFIGDFLIVPAVTTHALSLTCIFLSAALVPVVLARIPRAETVVLPVFVFAAGAVTNFVSFLFNPPMAPALIAFLVIASRTGRGVAETGRATLYAAGLVFLWFAGYAAAWIQKWLLAAFVLGPDIVAGELFGTFDKYDDIGSAEHLGPLGATLSNLSENEFLTAFVIAAALVAAGLLALTIRRHGHARERLVDVVATISPLLVLVAWVEAYPAHSAWHAGYVSRSFYLFGVLPLLSAIMVLRAPSPAASPR